MAADSADGPLGSGSRAGVKVRAALLGRMVDLDVRALRERFTAPHELVPTSDGKTLFVRHWPSPTRTDRAVLLFHGITAYSEPYGPVVGEELARSGWDVFGLDLRGHGRSDGVRGDYPSAERWTKDVVETVEFLRKRFARVVVLGHSLGVFSAIAGVNHAPTSVDGLVVVSGGTRVKPNAYPKPTVRAALKALLAITLLPHRRLIEYRREGMVGRDDPLFNFRYSARFFATIYGMPPRAVAKVLRGNELTSPNLAIRGTPNLPVWAGIGELDELFSVESARAFFERIPSQEKEFHVLPGASHTRIPPGSWGPLIAWLGGHFPAGSDGRGPR